MAINRSVGRSAVTASEAHLARVSAEGSARHRHLNNLLEASGTYGVRDLADAVHLLCSLHGRTPSLVEVALRNSESGAAREWLSRASEAFERERLYLVRLTSAVGPIPSTPGAAETEASLAAQRNALEILATSERSGCPLGAAAALVGDWWPVRRVLDRAATRAGLDVPAPALPDEASVVAVIDAAADTPARERALSFGSDQLLLQHRGLFDLLEARATARVDADR